MASARLSRATASGGNVDTAPCLDVVSVVDGTTRLLDLSMHTLHELTHLYGLTTHLELVSFGQNTRIGDGQSSPVIAHRTTSHCIIISLILFTRSFTLLTFHRIVLSVSLASRYARFSHLSLHNILSLAVIFFTPSIYAQQAVIFTASTNVIGLDMPYMDGRCDIKKQKKNSGAYGHPDQDKFASHTPRTTTDEPLAGWVHCSVGECLVRTSACGSSRFVSCYIFHASTRCLPIKDKAFECPNFTSNVLLLRIQRRRRSETNGSSTLR